MLKQKLAVVIIIFIALSCKQQNKEHLQKQEITQQIDLVTTAITQEEEAITPRFLELVRHIDSSGYIFDTTRYAPVGPDSTIILEDYVFFERTIEDNIIFYDEQTDGSHPFHEIIRDFNIQPFKKAAKITSYYFRQKEPDIIGDQKWYTDGVIEEWTFENSNDSEEATEEMTKTDLTALYANTGACVCCIENNMYIFHSRASAFMATQRKFFNWFVNQNTIELFINNSY